MAKKRDIAESTQSASNPSNTGRSWFFGIGINQYQGFTRLNNAVKDVEDIIALFQERYQVDEILTLFDEAANKTNIVDYFEEIAEKVQPEDKLLIYYSGHGYLWKETGYWIPVDAKEGKRGSFIRNATVRDFIKSINTKHTLLISDSCFSGALISKDIIPHDLAISDMEKDRSRWVISSGRQKEKVADGTPGKNSPFASSILKVLRDNHQSKLNVGYLADRVTKLTRYNYEQLPQGSPLFAVGHEGGQYVFHLKADEAAIWSAAKKENTLGAYQRYLLQFPNGRFKEEAQENVVFLEEERAWERTRKLHTIVGYHNYDKKYPQGRYSKQALEAIRDLEEEQAWQRAITRKSLYDLKRYKIDYPNGKYQKEAQARIAAIVAQQEQQQRGAPERAIQAPEKKKKPEPKVLKSTVDKAPEPERPGWLKQYGPWLLGLVAITIIGWVIFSVMNQKESPVELIETKEVPVDSIPPPIDTIIPSTVQETPTPPVIDEEWRGETLRVKISKGKPPYTLKLIRRGKTQYEKILRKEGEHINIPLTEYRKDAGTYTLQVTDDNDQVVKKDIKIDGAKEEVVDIPSKPAPKKSTSKIYKTVTLNGKTWMAENLNYDVGNGSWCYEDKSGNCQKYGRLYTWEAAKKACAAQGSGWRLPTDEEWREMAKKYGGADDDAKDGGKAAYEALIKGGNSGFSALLGGYRNSNGYFGTLERSGLYWSATEYDADRAWYCYFDSGDGELYRDDGSKLYGLSCRCLKD